MCNNEQGYYQVSCEVTEAMLDAAYEHDEADGWCRHDVSAEALKRIYARMHAISLSAEPAAQGRPNTTLAGRFAA